MEAVVSVVVPIYKVQEYIAECIESIQKQIYSNIELLLVDDGSPDESGAICERYAKTDKRIRVIHKQNGGVSSARNAGIAHSSGQYIMFVDGDDWLESCAIDKMMHRIKVTGTDACFCDRYVREGSIVKLPIPYQSAERVAAEDAVKWHLRYRFIASPGLGLLSLSKVKACYFDETIHALEDWEYNFRMLTRIDSLCICPEAYYHYRIVLGSASKSSLNARKMTCFAILDRVSAYIREKQLPYEKEAEYIPTFLINHMLILLANGDYVQKEGRQLRGIARKNLRGALASNVAYKRQKVYTLMAAISPRLFCWAYSMKYGGRHHA